jgi:hypothetical protein
MALVLIATEVHRRTEGERMRKVVLSVLALAVIVSWPLPSGAGGEKKQKVRLIVRSQLIPGTLASDLKSGKRITGAEIKASKAKTVNLSEVIKGKDEMPPTGDYQLHRVLVSKGKTYNTHDCYLSAALPQGTKLSEFVYKGTFTGTMSGEKHKYTYFEVTATPP